MICYIIDNKFLDSDNSEPDAKRAKATPKVLDGTFFTVTKRENDEIWAMCSECNQVKKGNVRTTGNFRGHYRLMHAGRLKDLDEYCSKSNSSKRPMTEKQPSITESFQNTSGDTVRNILNECLHYCFEHQW